MEGTTIDTRLTTTGPTAKCWGARRAASSTRSNQVDDDTGHVYRSTLVPHAFDATSAA